MRQNEAVCCICGTQFTAVWEMPRHPTIKGPMFELTISYRHRDILMCYTLYKGDVACLPCRKLANHFFDKICIMAGKEAPNWIVDFLKEKQNEKSPNE